MDSNVVVKVTVEVRSVDGGLTISGQDELTNPTGERIGLAIGSIATQAVGMAQRAVMK